MVEILLFLTALCFVVARRYDVPLLIILLFFGAYSFVGTSKSDTFFEHNFSDTALLLLIIVEATLLLWRRAPQIRQLRGVKLGIVLFFVFFIVCASIDIYVNHDKVSSVLKIFRLWFPISMAWSVRYIKPKEIHRLIKYVVVVSVLLSFLIVVQKLTSLEILHTHKVVSAPDRYSLPWILSLFVVMLLFGNYFKSFWVKWPSIAIIMINIVMSGSRSISMAYFVAVILFIMIRGSLSSKKIFALAFSFLAVVAVFSTDNVLSRRMDQASNEGMNIANEKVEGTFSLRILLLYERMDYMNQKLQYMVFGIGCVQEKDFTPNTFKIGAKFKWNALPQQLDTGDIAWAPLFLRFGYVGTFILIVFIYIPLMVMFIKRRQNMFLGGMGVYMLINLLMISFTYSYIYDGYYFLLPLALVAFVPVVDRNQKEAHQRKLIEEKQ